MANKHSVRDDGDPRKYYAAIPNIVFTLGLNPFELTLYVYLKKVAGDDGACWKSTASIAKECNMSAGMVSKLKTSLASPRPELSGKPLIVIATEMQNGGNPNHGVTITDIWPENMAELERVRRVKASRSPHEGARSPGEVTRSYSESTRSRGELKNNSLEEEPSEEKKEPTAHARLMNFLSLKIGPIPNGAKEGKAIKWLLESGYEPKQCEACFDFLASEDWRTAAVTWVTVKANIGAWLGKNTNGHKSKQTASERNVENMNNSLDYLNGLSDERLLTTQRR